MRLPRPPSLILALLVAAAGAVAWIGSDDPPAAWQHEFPPERAGASAVSTGPTAGTVAPRSTTSDTAAAAKHVPALAEPRSPVDSAPRVPAGARDRSPDERVGELLRRPVTERLAAASELLIGLADRPEEAARVARALCAQDPQFVREHGNTLVTAFTEHRLFGAAVQFAENGGPERAEWVAQTFRRWAEVEPAAAMRAALAQAEPDGLAVVGATWSERDPAAFAAFARDLPEPPLRAALLADALRRWSERDPEAAAAWLDRFAPALGAEAANTGPASSRAGGT